MGTIYIVGAQCTGKTTLTQAVASRLAGVISVEVVSEMARSVLQEHNFTRDDIRQDSKRCMQLQKLILDAQWKRESELDANCPLVSDRSGIDPLVYASVFAKDEDLNCLSDSSAWKELAHRMRQATVVVCEPVVQWLYDDGTRLMPASLEEWKQLHRCFCHQLDSFSIPSCVLPAHITDLNDRVAFVVDRWQSCVTKGN